MTQLIIHGRNQLGWANLLVPSFVLCLRISAAWISLEKTEINQQKRLEMLQTITCANKTNEQIKAVGRTRKRPELLGDGAVAFQASCGQKDCTATPIPYIMRPSASERGIPANAVSRLESFIRFYAGSLEIHVRGIYGKWCLIPQRGLG